MAYSLKVAQDGLYTDIENNLAQRERAVENLISGRMELLNLNLQSASANRVFADLVSTDQPADFQAFASELAFLFQDSAMAADLDVMFLLDNENELLIDAGLPLYNIDGLLADISSPIQYTGDWQSSVVTPIRDTSTASPFPLRNWRPDHQAPGTRADRPARCSPVPQ